MSTCGPHEIVLHYFLYGSIGMHNKIFESLHPMYLSTQILNFNFKNPAYKFQISAKISKLNFWYHQ